MFDGYSHFAHGSEGATTMSTCELLEASQHDGGHRFVRDIDQLPDPRVLQRILHRHARGCSPCQQPAETEDLYVPSAGSFGLWPLDSDLWPSRNAVLDAHCCIACQQPVGTTGHCFVGAGSLGIWPLPIETKAYCHPAKQYVGFGCCIRMISTKATVVVV